MNVSLKRPWMQKYTQIIVHIFMTLLILEFCYTVNFFKKLKKRVESLLFIYILNLTFLYIDVYNKSNISEPKGFLLSMITCMGRGFLNMMSQDSTLLLSFEQSLSLLGSEIQEFKLS
jgi:hypothetical protein